ncbi:MAG: tetratricopeptide repeat protein [Acidobacteriia bacterium]|nr:tetratricopeptide repeat protein [Terriglobia bacterium]
MVKVYVNYGRTIKPPFPSDLAALPQSHRACRAKKHSLQCPLYNQRMDSQSLIDQFREVVELTPDDEMAHYGLGTEYFKAGRFEEAAASFLRVVELKPEYAAGHRELGKALDKAGRSGEAQTAFEKARDLAANHGDGQMVREVDVYLKRITKKVE